jgi:hypothetical protein
MRAFYAFVTINAVFAFLAVPAVPATNVRFILFDIIRILF